MALQLEELFALFKQHTSENREDNNKLYELNAKLLSLTNDIREQMSRDNTRLEILINNHNSLAQDIKYLKCDAMQIKHIEENCKSKCAEFEILKKDVQKIKELDIKFEMLCQKVDSLANQFITINNETEIIRFASKYPNLFKLTILGIIFSIILSFGNLVTTISKEYSIQKQQHNTEAK